MKIIITRSQVAQMYTELCNENLKESFIVEGDEVVETATEPVAEEAKEEVIVPATEETIPASETDAPAPTDVAPSTDVPVEETPAA